MRSLFRLSKALSQVARKVGHFGRPNYSYWICGYFAICGCFTLSQCQQCLWFILPWRSRSAVLGWGVTSRVAALRRRSWLHALFRVVWRDWSNFLSVFFYSALLISGGDPCWLKDHIRLWHEVYQVQLQLPDSSSEVGWLSDHAGCENPKSNPTIFERLIRLV